MIDGCRRILMTTINHQQSTDLFCLFPDHRAFADLEEGFLCALDDKARIFDLFYLADDAAVRDHLIVDLQLADQILKLLTLFFLRQDHKKIENAENRYKRQNRPYQTAA